MSKRYPIIILGVQIGTCSSFNPDGDFDFYFYDFESIDNSLPEGYVELNLEKDQAKIWVPDENEDFKKVVHRFSILDYINKLKQENKNGNVL